MLALILAVVVLIAFFLLGMVWFIRWGSRWGARPEELALKYTADLLMGERRGKRVKITRGISIAAPPEVVWPWLAQMGRGAGYYSYDRLDNDGKVSARHIVSWIPEPQLGDAVAFGYLRHLEPGRELVWWTEECRWIGATWRGTFQYRLQPDDGGSRLVAHVVADARGLVARPALWAFQSIDFIMMRCQLLGLKERAEQWGSRREDPTHPETGARDQYQGPIALLASGQRAGSTGEEQIAAWRRAAITAGVLTGPVSRE